MFNPLGQFGQQAKLVSQMFKIQKELSNLETEHEDKGIRVMIKGGGLITAPQIKELKGNGNEGDLVAVLNQALKKSHERAIKKLQEIGGGQWFFQRQ